MIPPGAFGSGPVPVVVPPPVLPVLPALVPLVLAAVVTVEGTVPPFLAAMASAAPAGSNASQLAWMPARVLPDSATAALALSRALNTFAAPPGT